MGWLFKSGCSRRDLIAERTEDWERTTPEGVVVKTTCLAHCYRGGVVLRRPLDRVGTILHERRRSKSNRPNAGSDAICSEARRVLAGATRTWMSRWGRTSTRAR